MRIISPGLNIFLIGLFVIAGCASNEVSRTPDISDRISKASKRMEIIEPSSNNWCGPAKSCTYLGELYCDSTSYYAKSKCMKKLRRHAVRYGGDTLVLQNAENVTGSEKFYNNPLYRTFGQLYSCNNTNQALHKEYKSTHDLEPLSKVQLVTKAYATQCKTIHDCTKDKRRWSCGTIQEHPLAKCQHKFAEDARTGRSDINHIVLKEDKYNNAGFYRMYIDSYRCKGE